MIADLFLRTYPKDYRWLPFLFRSLRLYASDWRNVVIVFPFEGTPEEFKAELAKLEDYLPLKMWAERLRAVGAITGKIGVSTCQLYKDDYIGQCMTKLQAWLYSNADEIAFLDSDLVFVKHFCPLTLRGGKHLLPTIEYREWSESGEALKAWFNVTKTLLHGESPPYETMCRHPFQYPAQFIRRAFEAMQNVHLPEETHISEFNYLGNYAILHERSSFNFSRPPQLHQENGSEPDNCESDLVHQFWSHKGPEHPDVEKKLRELGVWEDPT